jgi:hypothetical protein
LKRGVVALMLLCAGCSAFNPNVGPLKEDSGSVTCTPPPASTGNPDPGYEGVDPASVDAGTCGDAS